MSLFVSCNDMLPTSQSAFSLSEHWKLIAESSEFHFTLSRAQKAHIFPTRNTQKKRYILSEKRESGMALKKRDFTPESGTVDTYDN